MVVKATELNPQLDFTKLDQIISLFPVYKRKQLESKKPLPKSVNIENFTMKTPYGDQVLLENTDLALEPNRKQCLIGPNCSGKTLLFHYIATGQIREFPPHLHVHHCKELEPHEMNDTVLSTVVNADPFRNTLILVDKKLRDLISDPGIDALQKAQLSANLEFVETQMKSIGGYTTEERAKKMLRVLGFDEVGQNKVVGALSGGLKMRVALSMAFIHEADLLLLDEPTNHLDFPSVLWLENRLRAYKGSFLLVSHDRELLKNVCHQVLLIEDRQIRYYKCGFLEFEKKKALDDKKKYEEIEKFLQKHKNSDPSTPVGRQALDKRAWVKSYHEKLVALQSKFTFPAPAPLAQPDGANLAPEDVSLINLQNVRFSYDVSTGHFIFNDPISFNVKSSTRVGVMGPNGAGKSTFLKLLTEKLKPTEGSVIQHPDFKLAYFGQHSTAELDLETSAIEYMINSFPDDNPAQLRSHLGKTGIIGTIADTRIEGLSYSQRSCVVFAKLTYAGPHLLILDEPTNFLDLPSVDSLILACNKYKGAILLVSHNRDFLKKCASQYLSIVPGHFMLYNDLKTAEKATYTFIEEMEEGGKVGRDVLLKNPGGGSVHSSQKVGTEETKDTIISAPVTVLVAVAVEVKEGQTTAPASSSTAAPTTPATTPDATSFLIGEKCQAKYSGDGRWYKAVIKGMKGSSYEVMYPEYGNTELVLSTDVKKALPHSQKSNHSNSFKKSQGANQANPRSHPANNRRKHVGH